MVWTEKYGVVERTDWLVDLGVANEATPQLDETAGIGLHITVIL